MTLEPSAYLPITACIIARDEEDRIADAILGLSFAAEVIVIVDSRTSDRTANIARSSIEEGQTIRVVEREWGGHIAQKNVALDLASNDWVFCIDADERVSKELAEEIRARFEREPEKGPREDGYTVPRKTYCLGRWIRHGGWFPDRKLRLFRRERGRWGGFDPHDHVELSGRVGALSAPLEHESYANVRDHIDKMAGYATIAARGMRARGVRLPVIRMLVHPFAKFIKAYVLKRGFLDGFPGLLVATLGAFSVFLKYAKLWELRDNDRRARLTGAVPVEDPNRWWLPPPD